MRHHHSSKTTAHREKELQRLSDKRVAAARFFIALLFIEPVESPSSGAWGRCTGSRSRSRFLGSRLGCTDWTPVVLLLVAVLCLAVWEHAQAQDGLFDLPDALTARMAQVAKGEDGADPTQPACVMRNRIIAGWSPAKVLNHFYAPARPVSDAELAAVREVLRTGAGCNPDAYYQWSASDVARIQPDAAAWLYSANGNHYYRRDALQRGGA